MTSFSREEKELLNKYGFQYSGVAMGKSWGSYELHKEGKRLYFRINNNKLGNEKKELCCIIYGKFWSAELKTPIDENLLKYITTLKN